MHCGHCGAGLTTEQLRAEDCFYCGMALPHSARAVEKAQMVKELMQDRDGDGVPDIMQPHGGASPSAMQVHVQTSKPIVVTTSSVTVSSSSSDQIPEEAAKILKNMGITMPSDSKVTVSGEMPDHAAKILRDMGAGWPTGGRSQSHQVRVETTTTTKSQSKGPRTLWILVLLGIGAFVAWLLIAESSPPPPPPDTGKVESPLDN